EAARAVAHREDVADVRAVLAVDRDAPALVGLEPDVLEIERAGVALPSRRVEDGLRVDLLAGGEPRDGAPVLARGDAGHRLVEPERHVVAAEDELERLADLAVEERQHA